MHVMMNPLVLPNAVLDVRTISIPIDFFVLPLALQVFSENMAELGVAMFGAPDNSVAEGIT
jgi:hypothetical protein